MCCGVCVIRRVRLFCGWEPRLDWWKMGLWDRRTSVFLDVRVRWYSMNGNARGAGDETREL